MACVAYGCKSHSSEKCDESRDVSFHSKENKMAEELDDAVADLEDGEIESDGEDTALPQTEQIQENKVETAEPIKVEESQLKESKKKKSKNYNKEEKPSKGKDKNKKKRPSPVEDDFAGNIEKAIRKAMKNDNEAEEIEVQEENGEQESRRKSKKRKKHDSSGTNKKRRRRKHTSDEFNDDEMMFTRGASPVRRSPSPYADYHSDDSYASEGSYEEHRNHNIRPPHRNRPPHFKDRKNNKNNRDRRRDNIHPLQDPDGVCVYFMQGKCHKGDDCSFSHDAQPPRKMELCKFYLMDCCAKRDKCLYMHADFPCKYYHTGLPCIYKDECKFAHGGPLTDNLKSILLKHLESAPKEILGDFPRLNRESAAMMVANTQMRLTQQFSPGSNEFKDPGIPSIFELNVPKPMNSDDMANPSTQLLNQQSIKNAQKVRHSRWQTTNTLPNLVVNTVGNQDVLNIKNLTGVLSPQQISDLTNLGIENLNQLSSLTVIQLNQLGLNVKQINEIQLNTMSIQKLGLINGSESQPSVSNFSNTMSGNKDLDMRVPPMAPEVINKPIITSEAVGKDVDMRFQPAVTLSPKTTINEAKENKHVDPRVNKDAIDIDQYTKDALKFASKEKENIDNMSTDFHEDQDMTLDIPKTKDIDQRVLQFKDIPITSLSEVDTDIRFLQPDNYPKKAGKRHRRSTTDDEDNNLLIDEKWYSSDEEKSSKTKSPKLSPRPTTPPTMPALIEPTSVLNKLGDLSKIDISDEVTKLLTTMKNKLHENKNKMPSPSSEHSKPRDPRNDPRSLPKKSPDHKSPSTDLMKMISQKKSARTSIYECIEGEPTDGRKRSDVDLRQLDQDFRLPSFGDTDLRPTSSGDIDFRYGLPFKPLPNYTPATEIDGSINCHPPIAYKLKIIDIPRPNYADIKDSTAKSQAMSDPRLRKLFRLSIDESNSDSEKSTKIPIAPRADPRRKSSVPEITEQKPSSLDLQNVTNNSTWYKDLSTNQKIFVNQQLASVNSLLKKYQQEKHLGKRFDASQIHSNPILCSIFNNLGVTIDEVGELSYISKSQDSLLKTPLPFSGNPEAYGNNVMDGLGMMNTSQMPMSNMGPMGNMNMNSMGGYNGPFPTPDPRATPGLLGIAPNMPHGFDNANFGPPNFGPEGFHGNMPFNAQGNDFGNMDIDPGYHRNQSRGNYRGRGNDRWNRGSNRGNRDRRNFNDRGGGSGGWKSDRH